MDYNDGLLSLCICGKVRFISCIFYIENQWKFFKRVFFWKVDAFLRTRLAGKYRDKAIVICRKILILALYHKYYNVVYSVCNMKKIPLQKRYIYLFIFEPVIKTQQDSVKSKRIDKKIYEKKTTQKKDHGG